MLGGLESEAVPWVGDCPIHDCTRSNRHGAETHSGQARFWCLHLVVCFVPTTFMSLAGRVVGTRTDDAPKGWLRLPDEVDDPEDHHD